MELPHPPPPLPPRPQIPPSVYQPLTFHNFEFRVLTLLDVKTDDGMVHCSLSNHYLSNPPEYRALSYCWGDPSCTRPIHVNGYTMQITTNLEVALRKLKSKNITNLWVDALCINQQDLMERGIQVSRMGLIYSKAYEVVAWLGEDAQESDQAMEQLLGTKPFAFEGFSGNPILILLRRPFWERIWIIQEISKAREVQVLCGDRSISWSQLKEKFSEIGPLLPSEVQTLDHFRSRERGLSVHQNFSHRLNLSQALSKTTGFVSSDERDKIYALLGLTSDGPEIVFAPNYIDTVEDVYFKTIRDLVGANHALSYLIRTAPLNDLSPNFRPHWTDLTAGVPSWMIQLTGKEVRPVDGFFVLSSLPIKGQGQVLDSSPRLSIHGLFAMGCIFDAIETIASSFPRKFGAPGTHQEFSSSSSQLSHKTMERINISTAKSIAIEVDMLAKQESPNLSLVKWKSENSQRVGNIPKVSFVLKSLWRALISKECWGRKENLAIMRFDHVRASYAFTHLCKRSNWEQVLLPASNEDYFSNWVYQNKDFVLYGQTLQQWVEQYAHTVAYEKQYRAFSGLGKTGKKLASMKIRSVEEDEREFIAAICVAARANLRLAITTSSMLVLVPSQTQTGNVVGVIRHSWSPIVLRQYEDSYRFIGEVRYPIRFTRPVQFENDKWDEWESGMIKDKIVLPPNSFPFSFSYEKKCGKEWTSLHIF